MGRLGLGKAMYYQLMEQSRRLFFSAGLIPYFYDLRLSSCYFLACPDLLNQFLPDSNINYHVVPLIRSQI